MEIQIIPEIPQLPAFHIRYTCSDDLQTKIVEFITRNADRYIVSQEVASREHIQSYVETNVVKKTWVNKFNAKFKGMDRRDKYVMPDKGRTKWYVCKGEKRGELPIVLAKRGFTDADILKFHNEYWDSVSPEIEEQFALNIELKDDENVIQVDKAKKKIPKPPTFMKQCRIELEDEYPDRDWSMKHKPTVFKKIMYKLGEGCRNLDHIIISRMTYGVLNSLIKDKQEWLEYWYQKSFGQELSPHDDY